MKIWVRFLHFSLHGPAVASLYLVEAISKNAKKCAFKRLALHCTATHTWRKGLLFLERALFVMHHTNKLCLTSMLIAHCGKGWVACGAWGAPGKLQGSLIIISWIKHWKTEWPGVQCTPKEVLSKQRKTSEGSRILIFHSKALSSPAVLHSQCVLGVTNYEAVWYI